MKVLVDRTEIAMAMNFGKYPVIRINMEDRDDYGVKGTKIRINNGTFRDGMPYILKAKIRTYSDENGFHITQGASILKDSFGYSDIDEMAEYANAPIVNADEDVVMVFDFPSKREAVVAMMHTGKRIEAHCSTPLTIE